jgi:hypothetical protein
MISVKKHAFSWDIVPIIVAIGVVINPQDVSTYLGMLFLMNNYFPSQTILKMHHTLQNMYLLTLFLQNMLLPTSMPHVLLNSHDSTATENVMPRESYSPDVIASHMEPHI